MTVHEGCDFDVLAYRRLKRSGDYEAMAAMVKDYGVTNQNVSHELLRAIHAMPNADDRRMLALNASDSPSNVTELLWALYRDESLDGDTRGVAALGLAKRNVPGLDRELIPNLSARSPRLRDGVLISLGAIGTPDTSAAMFARLKVLLSRPVFKRGHVHIGDFLAHLLRTMSVDDLPKLAELLRLRKGNLASEEIYWLQTVWPHALDDPQQPTHPIEPDLDALADWWNGVFGNLPMQFGDLLDEPPSNVRRVD